MKSHTRKLLIAVLSVILSVCLCSVIAVTLSGKWKKSTFSLADSVEASYTSENFVITEADDFAYEQISGDDGKTYTFISGFSEDFKRLNFTGKNLNQTNLAAHNVIRIKIPEYVPAGISGIGEGLHVDYVQENAFGDYLGIGDVNTPDGVYWQVKKQPNKDSNVGMFTIDNTSTYAKADGRTASITAFNNKWFNDAKPSTVILPSPLWYDVNDDGVMDSFEGKYPFTEMIGDINFGSSDFSASFGKSGSVKNLVISSGVNIVAAGVDKEDGTTKVEDCLRKSTSLESVYFATGRTQVLSLYALTFEDSFNLKKVTLSSGVLLADGARAFQGCTALSNVYITPEQNPNVTSFYVIGEGGALYTDAFNYKYYDRDGFREWWKWYADNHTVVEEQTSAPVSSTSSAVSTEPQPNASLVSQQVTFEDKVMSPTSYDADGNGFDIPEGSVVVDFGEDNIDTSDYEGVTFTDNNISTVSTDKNVTISDNFAESGEAAYIIISGSSGASLKTGKSIVVNKKTYKGGTVINKDKRYIQLHVPADFDLVVYMASNDDKEERTAYLLEGVPTSSPSSDISITVPNTSEAAAENKFFGFTDTKGLLKADKLAAGDYYLTASGEVDVFAIVITPLNTDPAISMASSAEKIAHSTNENATLNVTAKNFPEGADAFDVANLSYALSGGAEDYVELSPSSGSAEVTLSFKESLSDEQLAAMDGKQITVTATYSDAEAADGAIECTATAKITLLRYVPTDSIALNKPETDTFLYDSGEEPLTFEPLSVTLTATVTPVGGGTAPVVWQSSDPAVEVVGGVVTPTGKPSSGKVTITATSGAKSTSQTFTFSDKNVAQDIAIESDRVYAMYPSDSTQVTVTALVTMPFGSSSHTAVTWASSNPDVIANDIVDSYKTVDGADVHTVSLTISGHGSTVISASAPCAEGEKTVYCIVYVDSPVTKGEEPAANIAEHFVRYQKLVLYPPAYNAETFDFRYQSTTIIGNSAFYGTQLTVIDIPDRISKIEDYAFRFSNNLQTVYLPSSATYGSAIFGQESDAEYNSTSSYNWDTSNTKTFSYSELEGVAGSLGDNGVLSQTYFNTPSNSFIQVIEGSSVTFRTSNCFEIKGEALKFTFKGTGTLSLKFSSTGGSNTSNIGLKGPDGNFIKASTTGSSVTYQETDDTEYPVTNYAGTYTVTGTTPADLSYEITKPGDYILYSNYTHSSGGTRGCRISSLSMTDNGATAEKQAVNKNDVKNTYTAGKDNFVIIAPSREAFKDILLNAKFDMVSSDPGGNSDNDGYSYSGHLTYEIEVTYQVYSGRAPVAGKSVTQTKLFGKLANFTKNTQDSTIVWSKDYNNNVTDMEWGHKVDKQHIVTQNLSYPSSEEGWDIASGGWYIDFTEGADEFPTTIAETPVSQYFYGKGELKESTEVGGVHYSPLSRFLCGTYPLPEGSYIDSTTYTKYGGNEDYAKDPITFNMLPYFLTITGIEGTENPIYSTYVNAPLFQNLSTPIMGGTMPTMYVEFDFAGYPISRFLSGYDAARMTAQIESFKPYYDSKDRQPYTDLNAVNENERPTLNGNAYDVGTYIIAVSVNKKYSWQGVYNNARITHDTMLEGVKVSGNDKDVLRFELIITPRRVSVPGESFVTSASYTGADVSIFENQAFYSVEEYLPFGRSADGNLVTPGTSQYESSTKIKLSENNRPFDIGSYYTYLKLFDDKYTGETQTPNLYWDPEPTEYDSGHEGSVRVQLNISDNPKLAPPTLQHPDATISLHGSRAVITYTGNEFTPEQLFGSSYTDYNMQFKVRDYKKMDANTFSNATIVLNAGTYHVDVTPAAGYEWRSGSTHNSEIISATATLTFEIVVEKLPVNSPADQYIIMGENPPYPYEVHSGEVYSLLIYQKLQVDGGTLVLDGDGNPVPEVDSVPSAEAPTEEGAYWVTLDLKDKDNYEWLATGKTDGIHSVLYVLENGAIPVPVFKKLGTISDNTITLSYDPAISNYGLSDLFNNYLPGLQTGLVAEGRIEGGIKKDAPSSVANSVVIKNAGTYTVTFYTSEYFTQDSEPAEDHTNRTWWADDSTHKDYQSAKTFYVVIEPIKVEATDETAPLSEGSVTYAVSTGYRVVGYQKYDKGSSQFTTPITEVGKYWVELKLVSSNYAWASSTGVNEAGNKVVLFTVTGEIVNAPTFRNTVSVLKEDKDSFSQVIFDESDPYNLGLIINDEQQFKNAKYDLNRVLDYGSVIPNSVIQYNAKATDKIKITLGTGEEYNGEVLEELRTYKVVFTLPQSEWESGNLLWSNSPEQSLTYTVVVTSTIVAAPDFIDKVYTSEEISAEEFLKTDKDANLSVSLVEGSYIPYESGITSENIVNAGTYSLLVTAINNSVLSGAKDKFGATQVTLTSYVIPVKVNAATINVSLEFEGGNVYSGAEKSVTASFTGVLGGATLAKDSDYTIDAVAAASKEGKNAFKDVEGGGVKATLILKEGSAARNNYKFGMPAEGYERTQNTTDGHKGITRNLLAITPYALTISGTATASNVTYDGSNKDFTVTADQNGTNGLTLNALGSDEVSAEIKFTTTASDVGEYKYSEDKLTASVTSSDIGENYTFDESLSGAVLEASITIDPAKASSIEWKVDNNDLTDGDSLADGYQYVYNGKTRNVAAEARWAGGTVPLSLTGAASFIDIKTSAEKDGKYTFTVEELTGNVVFGEEVSNKSITVQVTPYTLNVETRYSTTWYYNEAKTSITAERAINSTSTPKTLKADETAVITFTFTTQSANKGVYGKDSGLSVSAVIDNINYKIGEITYNDANIQIEAAPLTVGLTSAEAPYIGYKAATENYYGGDGENKGIDVSLTVSEESATSTVPSYTLSYAADGAGNEYTRSIEGGKMINAGAYKVTVTISDDNYEITSASGGAIAPGGMSSEFGFTVSKVNISAKLVKNDGVSDGEDDGNGVITFTYNGKDRKTDVKAQFTLAGTDVTTDVNNEFIIGYFATASGSGSAADVINCGTYYARATLNGRALNNYTIVRASGNLTSQIVIEEARITISGELNLTSLEAETQQALAEYLTYSNKLKTIALTTYDLSTMGVDEKGGEGAGSSTHRYFYLPLKEGVNGVTAADGVITAYGLTISNYYGELGVTTNDVFSVMFTSSAVTAATYNFTHTGNYAEGQSSAYANIAENASDNFKANYKDTDKDDFSDADFLEGFKASFQITKREVEVKWSYTGEAHGTTDGYSWTFTFNGADYKDEVTAKIESEYLTSGSYTFASISVTKESEAADSVIESGTYKFTVADTTNYKMKAGTAELTFVVEKYTVQQTDLDAFAEAWENETSNVALADRQLDGEGELLKNSFARKREAAAEIKYQQSVVNAAKIGEYPMFTISYEGNNQSEVNGKENPYSATATFTLNSNFKWADSYTVIANHESTSVVEGVLKVVKQWYIIEFTNGYVWDAATTWVYGSTVSFAEPQAEVNPSGSDRISYQLSWSFNGSVTLSANAGSLSELLNSSTPAGTYRLTITVNETDYELQHYDKYSDTVTITVNAASVTSVSVNYNGESEFTYVYNGKVQLPSKEVFTVTYPNVTRSGKWADSAYDSYYDQTYEVGFSNDDAGTDYDYTATWAAGPKTVKADGAYTLYYNIRTAKNFASYSNASNAEQHHISVTITPRPLVFHAQPATESSKVSGSNLDMKWTYSTSKPGRSDFDIGFPSDGVIEGDEVYFAYKFLTRNDQSSTSYGGNTQADFGPNNIPNDAGEYICRFTLFNDGAYLNYKISNGAGGDSHVDANVTIERADSAVNPTDKRVDYTGSAAIYPEERYTDIVYAEDAAARVNVTDTGYGVYLTLSNKNYKWRDDLQTYTHSDNEKLTEGYEYVLVKLFVDPISLTIKVSDYNSVAYDTRSHTVNVSADNDISEELTLGEDFTVTYKLGDDATSMVDAGTYTVLITLLNNNFRIKAVQDEDSSADLTSSGWVIDGTEKTVTGSYNIEKAIVSVNKRAGNEHAHPYIGEDYASSEHNFFSTHYTVDIHNNGALQASNYNVTYDEAVTHETKLINAGVYTITVTLTDGAFKNYSFAAGERSDSGNTVEITAATVADLGSHEQGITVNDSDSFVYDGTDQSGKVSVTFNNDLLNSTVRTMATGGKTPYTLTFDSGSVFEDAKTYTLKVTLSSELARNFSFASGPDKEQSATTQIEMKPYIVTSADLEISPYVYTGESQGDVSDISVTFNYGSSCGIASEKRIDEDGYTLSFVQASRINAGTYGVKVTLTNQNYAFGTLSGGAYNREYTDNSAMVISKATVSFGVEARYYKAEAQSYTAEDIVFVIPESVSGSAPKPEISRVTHYDKIQMATESGDYGSTYWIEVTLRDGNYQFEGNVLTSRISGGDKIVILPVEVELAVQTSYNYNGSVQSIIGTGPEFEERNSPFKKVTPGAAEETVPRYHHEAAHESNYSGYTVTYLGLSGAATGRSEMRATGRYSVTITLGEYTANNFDIKLPAGGTADEITFEVEVIGVDIVSIRWDHSSSYTYSGISLLTANSKFGIDTTLKAYGRLETGSEIPLEFTSLGKTSGDTTFTQADVHTFTAKIPAGSGDGYSFAADCRDLTIDIEVKPNRVVAEITGDSEVVYDGDSHSLDVKVYYIYPGDGQKYYLNEGIGFEVEGNDISDVGTAQIVVTLLNDPVGNHYNARNFRFGNNQIYIERTLTVTPAEITAVDWYVDGDEALSSYVYDGETHSVTAYGHWGDGSLDELTLDLAQFLNVFAEGYTFTAQSGGNFIFAEGVSNTFTLQVSKATPVIGGAADWSAEYDGTAKTATYNVPDYVDKSTVTVTYQGEAQAVNAGEYSVVITIPESANYVSASVTVKLTINKVTLSVQWDENTEFDLDGTKLTPYLGVDKTQWADKVSLVYKTAQGETLASAPTEEGEYTVTVVLTDSVNFALEGAESKSFSLFRVTPPDSGDSGDSGDEGDGGDSGDIGDNGDIGGIGDIGGESDGGSTHLWLIISLSVVLAAEIAVTGVLIAKQSKLKKRAATQDGMDSGFYDEA